MSDKNEATFRKFQTTRRVSSDLAASLDLERDAMGSVNEGLVYAGSWFIEAWPDGRFGVPICNEYHDDYDLERIERLLFDYAADNGFGNGATKVVHNSPLRPVKLPGVLDLADQFAKQLRATLTPADMAEAVRLNREETDLYGDTGDTPGCCHTHDFCDANVCMLEAWAVVVGGGPEPDPSDERHAKLMDDAWNVAKMREFATSDTHYFAANKCECSIPHAAMARMQAWNDMSERNDAPAFFWFQLNDGRNAPWYVLSVFAVRPLDRDDPRDARFQVGKVPFGTTPDDDDPLEGYHANFAVGDTDESLCHFLDGARWMLCGE